jgi:hypothetical protein
MAAPLLAREAAFLLQALDSVCIGDAKPFAATVKAFLALTARPLGLPVPYRLLEQRAVGFGRGQAARLRTPLAESAVFVWQCVLDGPRTVAGVRLPIPEAWLRRAEQPVLRIACAWDSPVNEAAQHTWASRKVEVKLRAPGLASAVSGSKSQPRSYPLFVRRYQLRPDKLEKGNERIAGDEWIVEVEYTQTADYYPGLVFTPQQRVGVAIELLDGAEKPVSPQAAIQALPVAATMVRLGTLAVPLATPITVKGR